MKRLHITGHRYLEWKAAGLAFRNEGLQRTSAWTTLSPQPAEDPEPKMTVGQSVMGVTAKTDRGWTVYRPQIINHFRMNGRHQLKQSPVYVNICII